MFYILLVIIIIGWAKPTQADSPVTPSLSVHTSPLFMRITVDIFNISIERRWSPLMFYVLCSNNNWAKPTQANCPVTPSLSVRVSGHDWEAEPVICTNRGDVCTDRLGVTGVSA